MGLKSDIEKVFWWVKPTFEVFDLWKQIAAVLVAAAFFVWALIDHMPWSVIAAVVFCATTGMIYLLLLPALIRGIVRPAPLSTAPNLMMYKDTQRFGLHQAACLLAGLSPKFPPPNDEARDWLNALIEAIHRGAIERADKNAPINYATYITRDEFKKFCEAHNRKPEFLN